MLGCWKVIQKELDSISSKINVIYCKQQWALMNNDVLAERVRNTCIQAFEFYH